jgi:hypothetical protein
VMWVRVWVGVGGCGCGCNSASSLVPSSRPSSRPSLGPSSGLRSGGSAVVPRLMANTHVIILRLVVNGRYPFIFELWRSEQISRRRCSRFPLEMYHLPQETPHPQITGYATLLNFVDCLTSLRCWR